MHYSMSAEITLPMNNERKRKFTFTPQKKHVCIIYNGCGYATSKNLNMAGKFTFSVSNSGKQV